MATQSRFNRPYAELPAAGQNVRDMTPGKPSLANSPAMPTGRGMTPERRLQQLTRRALTRGDDAAVAALTGTQMEVEQQGIDRAFRADQARQGREFAGEQNTLAFERSKEMRGIDHAFAEKQHGMHRQDALDAESRRNEREDRNWDRNRKAEQEDRASQGIDGAFMMPIEGGGGIPMVKDKNGNARMAGGFMPARPEAPPPPSATEISGHITEKLNEGIYASWDPTKGGYSYAPVRPGKVDAGTETTTYDADGAVQQRTERKPMGGAAAGRKPYF